MLNLTIFFFFPHHCFQDFQTSGMALFYLLLICKFHGVWKRSFTVPPALNCFLSNNVETRLSIATTGREEKLKNNECVYYRKCLLLGSRDLNCLIFMY